MNRRKVARAVVTVGALVVAQLVVQVNTPAPASAALAGLVRAQPVSSPSNGQQIKNATAVCPPFTVVVGGGARISGSNSNRMKLTSLLPVTSENSGSSSYAVTAQAPDATYVGNWQVTAYAVCASRPAGYEIVPGPVVHNSVTFKQTAAVCPGGRRVIGTGAHVSAPVGQVGLQLARASAPLDIARATAREDAGTTGSWHVRAYAICANPVGAAVAYDGGTQSARATCPGTRLVHGAGGGGALSDLGPVFLRVVEPLVGLRQVDVSMTGTYPGGMVAQGICA